MIWANYLGERIRATPEGIANCPICNEKVIPKCGMIKIWHWSHLSVRDCDTWAEPIETWHLDWQNLFPNTQIEKVIGKHRADIITKTGTIIELQNSPISKEHIFERELFYNNMIWLINGKTLGKCIKAKSKYKESNIIKFKWSYLKNLSNITKPIFIDFGEDKILKLNKVYNFGEGIFISKSNFLKIYGDLY